jgi:hypothetical protein
VPKFYYEDKRFNPLDFLGLDDKSLKSFMIVNEFNVNKEWSSENPVLHCLLANELFHDVARLFQLIPERIDPNLCDGDRYGKKSLLILLVLLPSSKTLPLQFMKLFHNRLKYDYQDKEGKTALHYAVILGRLDLIQALIASGASPSIKDKNGLCANDYLNCSTSTIMKTLKKVDLEPFRDTKARSDTLKDHLGRPLMLQGAHLVQSKAIIGRILQIKDLVLIKYIEGSPGDWGTFIGDTTSATAEEMTKLAEDIAEVNKKQIPEVFIKEQLSADEQQAFIKHLNTLHDSFSGISLLEQCQEGHKEMTQNIEAQKSESSDVVMKPSL